MKISVLQSEFAKKLNLASRFVTNKAQLPILGNLKLKAETNKLRILGTNLETSIAMSIGAKVTDIGEITVPARAITELVSNLKTGTLTLDVQKEQLKLASDNFSSKVVGTNTADFPEVPLKLNNNSVGFPKSDLTNTLENILFAVSTDDSRPVLTGALFIFEPNKLSIVSSDGFRLSRSILSLKGSTLEERIIIPRNVLTEISRVFESEGDQLGFSFEKNNNQVIFGSGDTILSSRVIEGEFPDFSKIIPSSSDVTISVNKEDLSRAMKLSSVFARDAGNIIKMKVTDQGLIISAESSKTGSQEIEIDGKVEGESRVEISYNYRFIEDFLGVTESEEVQIKLTDTTSPGVFVDTSKPDFLHLIMPVRS